ncbi:MAG: peptide deformylase [Anaerolineales bacterium]|nr:peptide deformylase [Anaerolineales bacterium]MCB8939325.1 peptide deformylase [Ardenticatenaceae bacterium]
MTELQIVTLPDEGLRKKARPVTKFDDDLQTLIDNMIETMRTANGVGLAAPQIGQSLQLAVIETLPKEDENGEDIPNSRELFVIVNPRIVWESREVIDGIEGCLSIPGYVGEVERAYAVRVRAQDRRGKPLKLRLKGWTARIFQHEIDHLDGVLYIDKLTDREKFWTDEEYYNMRQEELEAEDAEENVDETAVPENRD